MSEVAGGEPVDGEKRTKRIRGPVVRLSREELRRRGMRDNDRDRPPSDGDRFVP